jgi:RNA polymerase sigma-70 factor (ECF subfamily)
MMQDRSSTSTSLLEQARQHQPEAWERLAKLYGPLVYEWSRKAGLQPDDASDIMQSVFATLSHKLQRFQRRSAGDSFRGWLYTVTRNQLRDFWRAQAQRANAAGGTAALHILHDLPESASDSNSVDGRTELNHLHRRALQLVQAEFEGRTWIAFWRTAVEGDDPKDVAADMDISVWAIYKAKARVLKRLRDEFEDLLS